MPDLTVSIVIYELDKQLLSQCLDALCESLKVAEQATHLTDWAIHLVDNGANENSLKQLQSAFAFDLTCNDRNLGYGAAQNLSILRSDSRYHLILNPDVELEETAILTALKHLENESETVILGPNGKDLTGQPCHLGKRYPSILTLFLRGFAPSIVHPLFSARLAKYEYQDISDSGFSEVQLLSGCCMFARTDVLKEVGGFDPVFFLYFEDFDLSLRMAKHGKVVYLPGAKIVHHGGNSARKGLKHIRMFIESAGRFFNRHGWKIV